MSDFYFTTISGTYDIKSDLPCDCPTLDLAKVEGRGLLARMATERLADDPCEMMSVEIFDAGGNPLTELRLMYQEIDK
jgi:hypothetical protein